jgi:quinol monooxygenase YgiN
MTVVIVAGPIYVDAAERERYLAGCRDVVVAARSADGCIDFHMAADPIESDRINVFEHWESVDAVEAFRGAGPSGEQSAAIRRAAVVQHEVASSTAL